MPLVTRLLIGVSSLAFLLPGLILIAVAFGPGATSQDTATSLVLGVLMILFAGWLLVQSIVAEKVTLIADVEGVHPVFLPKKFEGVIRWNEIRDIAVIEQKTRGVTARFLAFYLHDTSRSFGASYSGSEHGLTALVGGMMSDGGSASLYIPEKRLGAKAARVRDELLQMKNTHEGHV